MENNKKEYFPALTGLRAVAAYLVFFDHFPPFPKSYNGWIGIAIFHEFYIGVTVFFVLSGFLITVRYADLTLLNRKYLYNYFKNRFARIYPMYFLVSVITFVYYSYFFNKDVLNYQPLSVVLLTNFTLTKGFFNQLKTTGIAQGWTLTVEECFYALAPVTFFLLSKIKLRYHVLFFYSAGLFLVLIFSHINFYGFFDTINFTFITTFFGRCLDFYAGIQLALWYKKGYSFKFSRRNFTTAGISSILVVIAFLVACKGKNVDRGFYTICGSLANNFILPFCVAMLLWGLIFEKTWLQKILETKLFSIFGKSSYTFYLIHQGVLSEVLFKDVTGNYILSFPVSIGISVVLFYCCEQPLNKYIRSKKKLSLIVDD